MSYQLGIDLGTTFSAAAVHRDGRTQIIELGSRSASIPSVVFLREDETMLVGEAAQRRAAGEPRRVAREFKRRIGDPTPILLGGTPFSAEALTARLLAAIVHQVSEREGRPPESIAVTYPANWGPYKIDLLAQAVRLAGLDEVTFVTEPEAAVRHYASQSRVEDGSVIAVYDLGGGTFDSALLRKTSDGFETLGRPEGIDRLGGIDFDAAVLEHVTSALAGSVEALDPADPTTLQAAARLRQDCVEGKEALSADTEVSIPVMLPNIQTEVRLTRAEFEAMIRPALSDSLDAVRRALRSANADPEQLATVLLVGGSSRIPLVAQLVSNEFGRPVAVDADPKHAVALGAALVAAAHGGVAAAPAPRGTDDERGQETTAIVTAGKATGSTPATSIDDQATTVGTEDIGTAIPSTEPMPPAPAAIAPPTTARSRNDKGSRTPVLIGAAAGLLVAVTTAVIILAGSGGGEPDNAAAGIAPIASNATSTTATTRVTTATTAASETAAPWTTSATATTWSPTTVGEPTECPAEPERTACITSISIDAAGGLVAEFEATGYTPELEPIQDHIHFYFDTAIDGDERNAGMAGSGGDWRLWDAPNPFTATGGDGGRPGFTLAEAQAIDATQLCALVADVNHEVYVGTGNCIDLPTGR